VVIVIPIMVVVVVMTVTATSLYLFQLLAAFVSLSAVFTISLNRLVEPRLRLMDLPLTPIIVCACWQGRTCQSDDGQQRYAK